MKDSHVALSSSPTKKLTTTFCNPSVFRCIDYFVLLPKSPKVTLARRSSFAASLWQRLKRHAADVVADGSDSRRLDAAVYRAELLYPDYVGRLVQKTPSGGGVKRWCVLSDILFCVFVSERAERATDVILLPGNTVKSLIFRTASLYTAKSKRGGGNGGGGGGGWGTSKTLDDLDMFQFMIENEATGEKFKFSTANQLELDKWVSLLKIASCLDPTIVPPDDATSGDVNGDPMDPYQRATVPVPSDYYGDLSDQALYGDCSTLASLLPSTPARGQQQQQRDEYSADDSVGDEIRTPLGDRDAVRDSNRALAESGGAPARHGKKSITFSDVIAGGARTTDASRHAARAGGGGSSGSGAAAAVAATPAT
ncbi:PREDICTED: uncharacterized protein LOC106807137 [Priapulus caudatus]|uniref:Uncharacterized protein LOC106807137 n=1 Tax=Priapulus caudatus TaxID=37621 RepID=A0ABM1DY64_PRICU|nr:PREDICTED: uncharacterized protein LOC106807137 [Priapulus caudatus]